MDTKRYLVEGLVIVFSILLALLVDAAWDYRVDRVTEREYLESLRDEFEASTLELDADQEARDAIMARVDALLQLTASGGEAGPPVDSIGPWLTSAMDYRFYSPIHSVLDDLIFSGNLNTIRSERVRFAILDYVQEAERLRVAEERERNFVADQLEPFVARRIRIPDYTSLTPDSSDSHAKGSLPSSELRAMLADPEFASLLALRRQRTRTAMRFGEVVARIIQRVQERIGGELAD